jgi:hypothetical protein
MKKPVWKLATIFLLALSLALFCSATVLAKKGGGGPPGGEAAGNNLSYPVIWAEGVQKALRGTFGTVNLDGAWWYWWGTDLEGDPESCAPDPDDQLYCDDDVNGTVGPMPCNDGGDPDCRTVYLQQDALNEWQAESADWSTAPVNVDWIDWGDNLESVDWYTRSMVRTEVVLIQDLATPMTQYSMRHLYGWGQTEMHGHGRPAGSRIIRRESGHGLFPLRPAHHPEAARAERRTGGRLSHLGFGQQIVD